MMLIGMILAKISVPITRWIFCAAYSSCRVIALATGSLLIDASMEIGGVE